MTLSLIAAMAQNRVIGIDNDLPWHLPEDLKRFRTLTMGKPVLMGRKTFDSIVGRLGKPLPGRPNIVVSRSGFTHDGVDVYGDLKTAFDATSQKYPGQELMVIGGASVYEQALPLAGKIYLTIVGRDYEGDALFPEIGDAWTKIAEERYGGDPPYLFRTLEKIRP